MAKPASPITAMTEAGLYTYPVQGGDKGENHDAVAQYRRDGIGYRGVDVTRFHHPVQCTGSDPRDQQTDKQDNNRGEDIDRIMDQSLLIINQPVAGMIDFINNGYIFYLGFPLWCISKVP